MTKITRASERGVQFIKTWEKFVPHAYDDADPKHPPIKPGDKVQGTLTIGYGHTQGVAPGDTITEEAADRLLRRKLRFYEGAVAKYVTVPLRQNQFDALVALTYNIGVGGFKRSTVLKRLNKGDLHGAGGAFLMWRFTTIGGRKIESTGLLRRRRAEREMFDETPSEPRPDVA